MRDGRSADCRRTVLVVDDHPIARDGLRHLLSAEPDLAVCGEADTAADGRRLAEQLSPDLVILDLDLPDGDAFALLGELRSRPTPPRVVTMAGDGQPADAAERALRLGASAFMSKRAYGDELLKVARDALSGRTMLGDDLIERLVHRRSAKRTKDKDDVASRTAR